MNPGSHTPPSSPGFSANGLGLLGVPRFPNAPGSDRGMFANPAMVAAVNASSRAGLMGPGAMNFFGSIVPARSAEKSLTNRSRLLEDFRYFHSFSKVQVQKSDDFLLEIITIPASNFGISLAMSSNLLRINTGKRHFFTSNISSGKNESLVKHFRSRFIQTKLERANVQEKELVSVVHQASLATFDSMIIMHLDLHWNTGLRSTFDDRRLRQLCDPEVLRPRDTWSKDGSRAEGLNRFKIFCALFIASNKKSSWIPLSFAAPHQCPGIGITNVWLPSDSKSSRVYSSGTAEVDYRRDRRECPQVCERSGDTFHKLVNKIFI